MLRGETLRVVLLLLSTLPVIMTNSFVKSPGVVRGDVTGSAALEWTLQSEPGSDDTVSFIFRGADVFRYIPYTGIIPPRVIDGPDGNGGYDATYDHRFTIYNTSTRGVGFRFARLQPEDAGTYTCRYETLSAPITVDAVLFVYDVPGRPVIEASPQILVDEVTSATLECGASSTSLPVAYRPAIMYTWSRNGVDIDRIAPPERHAVLGDSEQNLYISPVHHTDTTYTCTASENGTPLTSEETEVTLDVLHGPYNLITHPSKPSAREDEFLLIRASADCNPACSFTWSIGDDVVNQGTLLRFDKFQYRDANNYTVRAQNAYGTADLGMEITLDTATAFVKSPTVVRGDVTGSVVLEWTLQSEPGSDDTVSFIFRGADVFRYIPHTGVIPPRVLEGPDGNGGYDATYDPRFTIYNTSTRGVGFRFARLQPEDAGTYTCRYETLSAPITVDAVLFVYDVPGRPVIEASPQILADEVTSATLECGASSTSLPVAYRPAIMYTWSRNGVDIDRTAPPERHAVLGDNEQNLDISPVHHTDTAYTCTASENGTPLTSEETEVTLDVLHGPYNLITNPSKPSAREDEFLLIRSSADCNPTCSFTWSIGDDVVNQGTLLRFDKFQSRDANNYTVRAQNAYGTADLGVEITLDTATDAPDGGSARHSCGTENIIFVTFACVSIFRF